MAGAAAQGDVPWHTDARLRRLSPRARAGHAGAAVALPGLPFRPAAHGSASFGGLPFAAARSLERSLESAGAAASGSLSGSLAKASSLPEAAEELSGVAQPEVDKQQVHLVRYACLSEGAPRCCLRARGGVRASDSVSRLCSSAQW